MAKINWRKPNWKGLSEEDTQTLQGMDPERIASQGTTTDEDLAQIHANEEVLDSRYGLTKPIVTKSKAETLYNQFGQEVRPQGEVPVFNQALMSDPEVRADLMGIRGKPSIPGYITIDDQGNRIYHGLRDSGLRAAKQSLRKLGA